MYIYIYVLFDINLLGTYLVVLGNNLIKYLLLKIQQENINKLIIKLTSFFCYIHNESIKKTRRQSA